MLDKLRLSELIRTKVVEIIPKCAHHWVIESTEAVPLRGRQAFNNPDCIGRRAKCKKCSLEQIKPERVY